MNIKYVVLSLLFVASAMATKMTKKQMTEKLKAVEGEQLKETFEKFENEQDGAELSNALVDMTKNEELMPKAVRCLEMAKDPYPKEASRVSKLVHDTVFYTSCTSFGAKTDTFADVVASFNPSAVKPLASIRFMTLGRHDARYVLGHVMKESPKLIMDSLPKWLASHRFDPNSKGYKEYEYYRKQAFEYLVSLATESVLSEALDIAKKNEHYKEDSQVRCCSSESYYPDDLISRLMALIIQRRSADLKDILTFLPTVLISLIGDYLTVGDLSVDPPNIKKNTKESQDESCLVM